MAELSILHPKMPRSLVACMAAVVANLQDIRNDLSQDTERLSGKLHAKLQFALIDDILEEGLHDFLTDFLASIEELGNRISSDTLKFTINSPTAFILMRRPRSGAQQWVARETYTLTPLVPAVEFTDAYGNLCQRLIAPPAKFSIHTSADVTTADAIDVAPGAPFDEVQNLPDAVLTNLLPSRYCESELSFDMASGMVAGVAPGYDQVACITDWIRREVRFNSASIYDHMAATDVNQRREGVCRDLAHLGIALCRALCIPARMVVGYLHRLEPMDLHAWFEAYVGGRWYTFDATLDAPCGGRMTVACGHDAANVAIFNQFGPALAPTDLQVTVEVLAPAPA